MGLTSLSYGFRPKEDRVQVEESAKGGYYFLILNNEKAGSFFQIGTSELAGLAIIRDEISAFLASRGPNGIEAGVNVAERKIAAMAQEIVLKNSLLKLAGAAIGSLTEEVRQLRAAASEGGRA